MGATTRDSNFSIPVETGTPPSFQRTLHYEDGGVISSSQIEVDVSADVE